MRYGSTALQRYICKGVQVEVQEGCHQFLTEVDAYAYYKRCQPTDKAENT